MLGPDNTFTPSFKRKAEDPNQQLIEALSFLSGNKIGALDLPGILIKVSENEALLNSVLETIAIEEFTKEDLISLATKNSRFALELAEGELENDLTLEDLWSLALHHEDVAHYLLDNKDLANELSSTQLCHLGRIHQSVAKEIVEQEDLVAKLKSDEIAEVGKNHLEVANYIYNNLRHKLDLTALCILVAKHSGLNKQVFEEKKAELTGKDLVFLSEDLEIAKKILSEPTLYNRLDNSDLVAVGARNHLLPEIQGIRTLGLDDLVMMAVHEESARYLMKTYRTVLSGFHLEMICKRHPKLALEVVHEPLYSQKLENEGIRTLGAASAETALAMISMQSLHAKMDGFTLAFLARKHYPVARQIYADSKLREKLQPSDYNILAKGHMGSMQYFCAFADIRLHLTEETLHIMEHNRNIGAKIQEIAAELLDAPIQDLSGELSKELTSEPDFGQKANKTPRL